MAHILAEGYAFAIAQGYARAVAVRYVMPGMKIVEDVRRERLKLLRVEFGTLSALNDKLGLNARDSTLSQYLSQWRGKVMGSDMARKIEEKCGKPAGWMDTDPELEAAAAAYQTMAAQFMQLSKATQDDGQFVPASHPDMPRIHDFGTVRPAPKTRKKPPERKKPPGK